MQTKMRNPLKLAAVLVLVMALLSSGLYRWNAGAAAALPATPCTGTGTVTCNLFASSGTVAIPGVGSMTVWGYSSDGVAPGLPGPVLIVNQGDIVTVNLTNNLTEATALLFQGQDMIPDLVGVAPGGTKAYTFTASQPGTYLYEASSLLPSGSAHQAAMGLYGALVVRPVDGTNTPILTQAYASPSSAFDEETLLVLSEIDPNLNSSVAPASFDMRFYHPTYFLINGKSYPATDQIDVAAGNKVLLRMVNAGMQAHSMSVLGLQQSIIAQDGSPFAFARRLTADTMFTGQTSDVIVTPSAAAYQGTKYAIYDAAFILSNKTSSGFGGMLAFLNLETGVALPPPDVTGPLTAGVTLTPAKVKDTDVSLTATVSDQFSGNSNVTAAEYFIGATGANGAGTAMTGAFGTPTVSVAATISTASLATGNYTIYVHGQDAAGNWGPFSSAVLSVDKTGPQIFSLDLVPNPSDGTSVLLEATVDDRATGDSMVDDTINPVLFSAEYSLDGGAWTLMTFETSASTHYFTAVLSASPEGTHTVAVRATDDFGNVGTTFADGTSAVINLVVDNTGPVTSGVSATPNATDGIGPGVNSSIAAVRVEATFTDGISNISAAEGFIDAIGADGTGFLFVPADGLFDSLVEAGYVDIPLSTFWILPAGSHTIYVHAKDASGNWEQPITATVNVTKN